MTDKGCTNMRIRAGAFIQQFSSPYLPVQMHLYNLERFDAFGIVFQTKVTLICLFIVYAIPYSES